MSITLLNNKFFGSETIPDSYYKSTKPKTSTTTESYADIQARLRETIEIAYNKIFTKYQKNPGMYNAEWSQIEGTKSKALRAISSTGEVSRDDYSALQTLLGIYLKTNYNSTAKPIVTGKQIGRAHV